MNQAATATETIPKEIDQTGVMMATTAQETLKRYEALVIQSDDEYTASAESLKQIKAQSSRIDDHRKLLKAGALDTCQRIDGFFRQPLAYLNGAEIALKKAILNYQQKKAAERAKLQREAEERARKERERLEAAAEKKAAKAEASGDAEKAEQIRQNVPAVVVPTVTVEPPKVAGLSTRRICKHRVIDAKVLPREYTIPNESMLAKFAEATKGNVAIPGVEFYFEDVIASARR